MQDRNGRMLFEEASSPAFFINDNWLPVSSISYVDKPAGNIIRLQLKLVNGQPAGAQIESINGNAFRLKITPMGQKADSIRLENRLQSKEEVYGLGEMWDGSVAQRGKALELWDQNGTPDECAYIPYYVTTSNYTYFLDYGGKVKADVEKRNPDRLTLEAPASAISILLTEGNTIPEAVGNYLKITGLPEIPPRWTFKPWFWLISPYTQPKGRYTAEDILMGARKYKELDIPAGVTWLEPAWQSAGNSFEPSEKFTKNFKGFVDELHGMGLKVLCWTTPYTQPGASNFVEASTKNYLVKNSVGHIPKPKPADGNKDPDFAGHYIDFTNPAAKEWWQTQINKVLALGIDGFKLDAGQDLPEDAPLHAGSGKDFHNAYARYYNQTYYEILNSKRKGDFLTIPRSAWSGSNKYSIFKWPGDLMASFADNGLPSSVYSSISVGFSGFPFVSTDIGGFSGRPTTEEVWVRWAQFGAMLPGMQTLNMPWWFSKKACDYYRYLSWLHTDMLPFWMSLAHEAHQTGAPLVRHLAWTFPQDETARHTDDEFTLGEALLVAPVTGAQNERKVYLPKGNWFNFWSGEELSGQRELSWRGDLFQFPLYAREGAIIPLEVQNDVTGFGTTRSKDYITMAIWPKPRGESHFVLEDREAPVRFSVQQDRSGTLQVKWSASKKKYIFHVHLENNMIPRRVNGAGGVLELFSTINAFNDSNRKGWYYERLSHTLWIKMESSGLQNNLNIYM
jgi:alpha-D-xyloside xylohydrolase